MKNARSARSFVFWRKVRDALMADALAWRRCNSLVSLIIVVYLFVYSVTCVTTVRLRRERLLELRTTVV